MKALHPVKHVATAHIIIDTRKCRACWECVAACKRNVIGRVGFLGHKHAHIDEADRCKGCLLCVSACKHGAIIALKKEPAGV